MSHFSMRPQGWVGRTIYHSGNRKKSLLTASNSTTVITIIIIIYQPNPHHMGGWMDALWSIFGRPCFFLLISLFSHWLLPPSLADCWVFPTKKSTLKVTLNSKVLIWWALQEHTPAWWYPIFESKFLHGDLVNWWNPIKSVHLKWHFVFIWAQLQFPVKEGSKNYFIEVAIHVFL